MYRFALRGFQGVLPYLGVGAGTSSINLTSGQWVFRAVNPGYVCAHVGAYYSSFYAQLGLGVGNFTISTAFRTPVFPVLQVGWTYSTASKTAAKTK